MSVIKVGFIVDPDGRFRKFPIPDLRTAAGNGQKAVKKFPVSDYLWKTPEFRWNEPDGEQ